MSLNTLLEYGGSAALRSTSSGGQRVADLEPTRVDDLTRRRRDRSAKISIRDKLFHAGFFSEELRGKFLIFRYVSPVVFSLIGLYAGVELGPYYFLPCVIVAFLIGLQIPHSYLDRRIARQDEEIMYYLPLVIEQLVVGVSSSLDIAPCIQRVVTMADERDSHNVVTELLRFVQQYVKSGVSFEDALNEVGILSGNTELKHTFMSLGQVVKHGGEITRQLQELADAVAQQRETKIEGKIKKLELEATGPVGLVFVGFMGILLRGLGAQMIGLFE